MTGNKKVKAIREKLIMKQRQKTIQKKDNWYP